MKLAEYYNKKCGKAIDAIIDAHIKLLDAAFKDCAKKSSCTN